MILKKHNLMINNMNKQRIELEALVKEVLKRQDRIIPVIGDDCFVGYLVDNNQRIEMPLQKWIAVTILRDTAVSEIFLEGYRGLDILFEECKRIFEDDEYGFGEFKEAVASCVEKGIKENKICLRNDVKEFLCAGKFDVIVTTTPFHILEKELNTGKNAYNVSSFAPILSKGVSRSEAVLRLPSIYQIFGDCEGDCVLGEDTLLIFLHYLNQTDTEKGYGASPLVKYIKDKGQDNKGLGVLMPIGCDNLPNWLFRFLWYPFSQNRLKGFDASNQGGVWHKHSTDEDFYKFLRKYRFKTFSGPTKELIENGSDGDPVLVRLTKELLSQKSKLQEFASSELRVDWNENDKWDIFISYAKEDEEIAQNVYDILTKCCGKSVWMDNRGGVRPGDDYWEVIQHGIDHSQGFIFIITEIYLNKAIDKNHRYDTGEIEPTGVYQEIERIKQHFLAKRKDGQKGYSFPIIIEGTKVTYTDHENNFHKDEILKNGVLEKLPRYKEYEMLQTEVLFYHIQDIVSTKKNLEKNLISVFNPNH